MFGTIKILSIIIAILIVLVIVVGICRYMRKPVAAEKFTQEENSKNFEPAAEIVLYYAMWCGYSKMFLPEWEKFETYAAANLPNLKVSKIRCEDGNEAVCSQKGVDAFPNVILYIRGGAEIPFSGDRTSVKLVEFVNKNVH